MIYIIVCLSAFLASGVTFFSGFGLGTVLMPVLAVFFPVPIAIMATAVVHFANNLFKLYLVGRHINRFVLIRFGIPAVGAALIGASLLSYVAALPVVGTYFLMGNMYVVTPIKLIIGICIMVFSVLEITPSFARIVISQKFMVLGGLLSGFFGGLSGNQGAFRSMFLIKSGLNKEEFVSTGIASSIMVDMARLLVYGASIFAVQISTVSEIKWLILAVTLSAFLGAFLGRELLKKVTLRSVQIIVAVMLILFGGALSIGLL